MASSCSLATSSATLFTFTPALASAGLGGLQHFQPRRDVDAIVGRRLLADRLLLRLHDIGQRGVARLVEAQVRRDDRRQLQRHGLQAAVDLARHLDRAVADGDLGNESPLAPAGQRREHLAGLVAVVVDRLLAHDDEAGLFRGGDAEDFRHRQRLDERVGLDENAAVGAHGERGADGFARLRGADGDNDDLGRLARLFLVQRLLDRGLVERVHRHLHVGELDPRAVRLDADLDVVINHPLHGHENLHG